MVHTKIPTLKAITVSVCVSILLSMSALAEAAGAHNNPNQSGREREKTETAECAESHSALTLSDGDTILCGTYTAEGENESVLEASSSVEASVTGAVLQKLSGSASSADASSFRGVNAAVRAYGNAVIRLSQCEIQASASDATGVFAYENSTIYMDDCIVNVTGGGAGTPCKETAPQVCRPRRAALTKKIHLFLTNRHRNTASAVNSLPK